MLHFSSPRTYCNSPLLRAAAFCLLFLLSGCSAYQNVTAYFNTYYNASRLFGDVERARLEIEL